MKPFLISVIVLSFWVSAEKKLSFHIIDRAYVTLVSNIARQKVSLEVSNISLPHLSVTNVYLIEMIDENRHYFGNDYRKRAAFYDLAASYRYHRLGSKADKIKAFGYWRAIIDLDLDLLQKAAPKAEEIPSFTSVVAGKGLERAMEMERYLFTTGKGHPLIGEIDSDRMLKTCREYEPFFTNHLAYSRQLKLNFFDYYLHRLDISNATRLFEDLGLSGVDRDTRRLQYLRWQVSADKESRYEEMENYLETLQSSPAINQRPGDKYFNYANSLLYPHKRYEKKIRLTFSDLDISDREAMKKAIHYYTEALKRDPSMTEANYNLGLLYAKLNHIPKATYYIRKALARRSDFKTLYSMGLIEMRQADYSNAYRYLKEAELHREDDPYLYHNLSLCCKYVRDSKILYARMHYIEKAISLKDNHYRFYLTKAEIYRDRNQWTQFTNQVLVAVRKLKEIRERDYPEYREIFDVKTALDVPAARDKAMRETRSLIGK